MAIRPAQEMSDTNAAIRAATVAQAQNLAPELYRQASDWYLKARQEYKFKNFKFAREYAEKARKFAEQAEFEALKAGSVASRIETVPEMPPMGGPPVDDGLRSKLPADDRSRDEKQKKEPYPYPVPQGTPAEPGLSVTPPGEPKGPK